MPRRIKLSNDDYIDISSVQLVSNGVRSDINLSGIIKTVLLYDQLGSVDIPLQQRGYDSVIIGGLLQNVGAILLGVRIQPNSVKIINIIDNNEWTSNRLEITSPSNNIMRLQTHDTGGTAPSQLTIILL